MAKHPTPDTGQMRSTAVFLIIYPHRLGEVDSEWHARPCGGYTWRQAEQAGAVEGRLCSIKKEWPPPIPTEGCDWLV